MQDKLPKGSKLIFKGLVGSHAYGLSTEKSDVDIKGIYIQSNEDILSNRYTPQINIHADECYYEIRRFLELVSTANPNVIELLFLPEHCLFNISKEYKYLRSIRTKFLSKKCCDTYVNYAKGQIQKSRGLNKKFNYEKDKTERKDIQDFTKVVDRMDGQSYKLKDWMIKNEYKQEHIGLAALEGFRDQYRLYTDDIAWSKTNHRFDNIGVEDRNYKGFGDEKSNEPRTSVIEKYRINDWKALCYFNREEYSKNCKNYALYKDWLNKRNENRVATNKAHGQDYDGKHILHTIRLLMTAAEIPTQNTINVDRTSEREYLLSIKNGEVDLKKEIDKWEIKADELRKLYEDSNLKNEVNSEEIKDLELKIRNNELPDN